MVGPLRPLVQLLAAHGALAPVLCSARWRPRSLTSNYSVPQCDSSGSAVASDGDPPKLVLAFGETLLLASALASALAASPLRLARSGSPESAMVQLALVAAERSEPLGLLIAALVPLMTPGALTKLSPCTGCWCCSVPTGRHLAVSRGRLCLLAPCRWRAAPLGPRVLQEGPRGQPRTS